MRSIPIFPVLAAPYPGLVRPCSGNGAPMVTRRQVIGAGAAAGAAALLLPVALRASTAGAAVVPGGTLDPTTLPKYTTPLFVLPAMPKGASPAIGAAGSWTAARQTPKQTRPAGSPATTVWAYGANSSSFHYPAFTIEAATNRPVRVTWAN